MSSADKLDQIIWQLFNKIALVVAEARIAQHPKLNSSENDAEASDGKTEKTNKWFNLETRIPDSDPYNSPLSNYRHIYRHIYSHVSAGVPFGLSETSNHQSPLTVQILLFIPDITNHGTLSSRHSDMVTLIDPVPRYIVLESWRIEIAPGPLLAQSASRSSSSVSSPSDSPVSNTNATAGLYKKCISMIRSIYSLLRILPTWKLHQRLSPSGSEGAEWMSLELRIGALETIQDPLSAEPATTGLPPLHRNLAVLDLNTPLSPDDAVDVVESFVFEPVPLPVGEIRLSVDYRKEVYFELEFLAGLRIDRTPTDPITTQLELLAPHGIDRPSLEILKDSVLGNGDFASVRLGRLRLVDSRDGSGTWSTIEVAVKELQLEQNEAFILSRFTQEVKIWSALHHSNILKFLGCHVDLIRREALLISPYLHLGGLAQQLKTVSINDRLKWVLGLTSAVRYLHSLVPPVVHGDLRMDNVLLGDDDEAVVFNFSHSCRVDQDASTELPESNIGALRWCSPELLHGDPQTKASDVWAWSLTVLEILTGRVPYEKTKAEAAIFLRIASKSVPTRDEYPELDPTSPFWSIFEDCWAFEPSDRPSIGKCYKAINTRRSSRSALKPSVKTTNVTDVQPQRLPSPSVQPVSVSEIDSILPLVRLRSGESHDLYNELRLVRRLKSTNGKAADSFKAITEGISTQLLVIKFIGVCKDPAIWILNYEQNILSKLPGSLLMFAVPHLSISNGRICAISRWCTQGNIWDFVNSRLGVDVKPLVLQIALGLVYLHEHEIIHSGMKVDNVLIGADGRAVLCDVGLTKFMEETFPSDDVVGPIDQVRWAAPEIIDGKPYTAASDVYSLALVILALEAHELPFWQYDKYGALSRARTQNPDPLLPDYPQLAGERQLWELLKDCWAAEVSTRPVAASVHQRYSDLPTRDVETITADTLPSIATPSITSDPVVGEANSWNELIAQLNTSNTLYRVSMDVVEMPDRDSTPRCQWTADITLDDGQTYSGRGINEIEAQRRAASSALVKLSDQHAYVVLNAKTTESMHFQ